jgi:phage terminase large subunit
MSSSSSALNVKFPAKAQILFRPARYKVLKGGRGSAKSHSVATYLLLAGMEQKHRFLCAREFQNSISESVLKLLEDKIQALNLGGFYQVQRNSISGVNGTEFFFHGLKTNIASIKSMEGITKIWLEEAQTVSQESLDIVIPTIRTPNSELLFTYNPQNDDDPVHKKFSINPPPDCLIAEMNWSDNPWLSRELNDERLWCLQNAPEDYDWIWDGQTRKISDACIFKNRVTVEEFTAPERARHFFGSDFGHAADPSTLVRCHVQGKRLFIDFEAYAHGLELDELPNLYDSVPGARQWTIRGDSSRPETISFLKKRNFQTVACDKWQGSVLDGIAFLKAFEQIVVHPRCPHMIDEFRKYSWKIDRITKEILPIPEDRNNHMVDALRYSLSAHMRGKTSLDQWAQLAS